MMLHVLDVVFRKPFQRMQTIRVGLLIDPIVGGRIGKHSEHLQPLLDEMSEVFRIDPSAEW